MNYCHAGTSTSGQIMMTPSSSLHMSIASEIYDEEFISHSSCQQLLKLDWYGPLDYGESGRFKVKLCFL